MMTNLLNGAHVANKLFSTIARLRLLLVMFLTLSVSAQVWGAEVTWNFESSDTELSNLSKDPISVSYAQNSGTNSVAISSNAFRLYKGSNSSTNGCSVTFTIASGYKIESITVVFKDGRTSARGKIDNGSYEDVFSAGNSKTVTISSLSAQSYSIQNQGSSTVAITSITITYSSNTSTPADPCTVTFNAGSGTCDTKSLTEDYAGAGVTLPPATIDCDDVEWTLAGWAEASVAIETEEAPTPLYEAGDTYKPTSDITLYAVYTRTETTSGGGGGSVETTKVFSGANNADLKFTTGSSSNHLVNNTGYTAGDANVKFTTGTNKNNSYYDGSVVRFYAGSFMIITPLNGVTITRVEIVRSSSTSSNSGTISADNLTASNSNSTINTNVFTGSSTTAVTFTNSAQCRFTALNVTYTTSGGGSSTTYYHSTPDCGSTEPSTSTYTVKHCKEGLEAGSYPDDLIETETPTGTIGEQVTPGRKNYTGFTAPSGQTETILENGALVITYKYTRKSYTLTWELGDGIVTTEGTAAPLNATGTISQSVRYETPITAPIVQREGYRFNKWNTSVSDKMPASDKSFTATWVKTWDITWKAQGNSIQTVTFDENALLTLPSVAVTPCEGMTHVGWTANENYNSDTEAPNDLFNIAIGTVTQNQTYYAVYAISSGYTKLAWGSDVAAGKYLISTGTHTITGQNGNITTYLGVIAYSPTLELKPEYEVNITKYNDDFFIQLPNTQWIGWKSSTDTKLTAISPESDASFLWTYTEKGIQNNSDASRYLQVNAANTEGRVYTSTGSGSTWNPTYLYARNGSGYYTSCVSTYTITYSFDGGVSDITNTRVKQGSNYIISSSQPTRLGYTFLHWSDGNATYAAGATINNVNTDITLTAIWKADNYAITLHTEGGTINADNVSSYTYGVGATLPTNVTRDGYRFDGWFDNSDLTGNEVTTISTTDMGDKEFWAKWTPIYTITWMVNGATLAGDALDGVTISVVAGEPIINLPTIADDYQLPGCTSKKFVGWSDSEISEETDTKPTTLFTDAASAPAIDGDKTFHAVFADEEGDNFSLGQSGDFKIYANVNDTYHYAKEDADVNKIPSTTNSNEATIYTFTKETIDEKEYYSIYNGSKYIGYNSSTDLKETAEAEKQYWSIQEGTHGSWRVTSKNTSTRALAYRANEFDTFRAYSTGNIDGNEYYDIEIGGGTSYSAYTTLCDATKATITYDLNGGTGATCEPQIVRKGEEFALCNQTPTKTGYEFAGWSDGTKPYTAGSSATVSENTTFYATWTPNTITITWDQNYTDCPEAATSTYIYDGEEIAMPAEPIRTGYKFTGWFDAATDGTQVTEVGETNKPTADVTYYAHWAELYTVTFRASGQVYVVQEHKYLSGETLELPADPSAANYACDGYIFEGWSADEKTEEDATLPELVSTSTTIDADREFYAVWKKATTEGAGGNGYYLVEEELTDYSGDYLIVSYDNNYAMSISAEGKIGTNTYAAFVDISAYYANKVIASNATTDTYVFTAAKTTNGYSLHCQQNDTYLGILNTSTGMGTVLRYYDEEDYNDKLSECEWTIGVGSVSNYAHRDAEDKSGAKGQYIRWNENDERFAIYKETSVKGIHLYKKGAGATYLYTTSPSCGPTIVAKDGMWVTSANGQSVKVNVPIAVKSFTTTATITGTSTNENFEITPLENVGNGINDVVEVIYTPTTADTKESATITLTAKDGETVVSTTTFTLNGRSLPDQFAIVVDKASEYFALPANMPSAGTYPGYSVALNAGSVTSAPKTHLYTAQAVHSTRFDENGTALRLVGNNNACLWATNAVSGTGIRNYAQLDNAKTADYEWNLYTEDGDTYRISCSIVTEEGRILRMYGANFGMYKSGAEVFYLLPVECTSTPTNIQVSPARVSATISWENAATCDLQVLKEGTPIQTISGAVSPVVVTGLTELTAYTFTLTPTDAASCKVDGAFTTTGPDIDIVEWMTDGMIIQVDKDDAVNPSVVINGEVEYNTGSGAVATELFFSKYFEAHGENKLLAIYNGTGAPIDLSGYEIKSENGALDLSQFGQTKGQVAPNEEIILVYYDVDYSAEECAEQQEGYENWNILTEKSVLAFSGRGSIGLYKDDVLIDVIGSTFPSGELTKIGKSGKPDYCGTGDDVRLYIDEESVNDQSSFFCYDGDNIKTDEEENNYAISTNRCLLIRKNTVTSGANAVATNKADAGATCGDLSSTFTTLCSEWSGFRIGGGKSSDEEIREATCDGLGYVGGFDYSKYYREYQQIGEPTTLDEFEINEEENLYKIPIDPLSNYSCLNVSVELRDPETDELLTQQVAQVPIIVASENTTTDELFSNIIADDLDASKTRCSTCDVVILKNATLTKAAMDTENDVNQVRNIYIYPGGKLVVPADGNDYSVNTLSLRRVEDEVSMASVQTPLLITSSAANPIYVDVRVNSENWHWFTLPYNCNIADVTWADGTPAKYNVDWFLMWYDGESRSNQKSNYESHWKVYEGTTLEAGKGYIVGITGHPTKSKVKYELRFPMAQGVLAVEQTDKTVAVNAWGVKKDIRPNHKGWNLVGNPYMDYYNTASSYSLGGLPLIEYADTYDPITGLWDYEERESGSVPFLVIPQDGGMSEYKQELASDVDMQPFTAYFVQVGDPNNDGHSNGMKLNASFDATQRGRSSLIRRAPSEVDDLEEPAIVAVSLTNAKGESDKTTLLIADRFTSEYEMNADFFKWFGDYYTYYTKPVLYTIGADSESRAFNALNEELAAQPVELGMYAAQTGNYTFSLHQRSNLNGVAEVWLHDASNNTHTNLLQDDYTFSTSKTNGAGRFSLSVKMMPKLPTDVENIKQGNVWATTQGNNIVINGLTKDMQLWIYDATGKLLHADHTTNYQHSYSVPTLGVYFVRVNGQSEAQTIKVVVE